LDAAVSAAFTHPLVDDDATVGVREGVALAQPPGLGGAGLVVDQGRHAAHLTQLALHPVELVAMVEARVLGEGATPMPAGLVAHYGDALHSLRGELPHDLGHRDLALERLALDGLPAGHGHGTVGQDLVGDVDPGCDGGPDGQQTGVEVRPIAHVLEDVRGLGEGCGPDPVGAFAPHLGHGQGAALRQPHGHAVTADPAEGHALLGHLGGRVVWAARAEGGQPHQARPRQAGCGDALGSAEAGRMTLEPAGQGVCHATRGQLSLGGHQASTGLVRLAREPRALGLVVE
jgi:hypothetical protein